MWKKKAFSQKDAQWKILSILAYVCCEEVEHFFRL